jgi:hypothetical protein
VNASDLFSLDRFVFHTMRGNLHDARNLLSHGPDAKQSLRKLLWPTVACVQTLAYDGLLSPSIRERTEYVLRLLADEIIATVPTKDAHQRCVLLTTWSGGQTGAHIASSIAKRHGWTVYFAGDSLAAHEMVGWARTLSPDVILMHVPRQQDRAAVDILSMLRTYKVSPKTQTALLSSAAEPWAGLSADLIANDPLDLIHMMDQFPNRRAASASASRRTSGSPAGLLSHARACWVSNHGMHVN